MQRNNVQFLPGTATFTDSAKALQTCKFQGECDSGKKGLAPLNDALTTKIYTVVSRKSTPPPTSAEFLG